MTAPAKIIALLLSSTLLLGCTRHTVFSDYHTLPLEGWHQDSVQVFEWDIQDTAAVYDIVIHVRHTERYNYQNMWLFVDEKMTDMPSDTIEFYLADNRGYWLGNNHGGNIDMPVLYEQAFSFDSIGTYHIYIQQGMRDSVLRGVSHVGLEISKH